MITSKKQRAYHYGMRAEKLAAWYLRAKGYRVLAERFRNRGGEIDIIARRGKTLVAVEVKARQHIQDCTHSITAHKQEKMIRTMQSLLGGDGKIAGLKAAHDLNIRFDVIWIVPRKWPHHIKDAFDS